MKVWLDDVREAPDGWVHVRTPEEAIELLRGGEVEEIGLDHDLGLDVGQNERTGYDVLLWLEEEVAAGRLRPPGEMKVHSGNVGAIKENGAGDRIRPPIRGRDHVDVGSPASWQPRVLDLKRLWPSLEPHPNLQAIDSFLARESGAGRCWYPNRQDIFRAFASASCDQVRCVIVGLDPYARGHADGLAFSVRGGTNVASRTVPVSLRNILHAIKCSHGGSSPSSTDLSCWASRGVLLLNAALTVPRKDIKWPVGTKTWDAARRAHQRCWEPFTSGVIAAVARQDEPLDFLLWGKDVWAYSSVIPRPHRVFRGYHPSSREFLCDGLSARPSTGCHHFSRTKKAINWL